MHPVLAEIELLGVERAIGSYGALLVLAIMVGSALLVRAAVRADMDAGAVIAVAGMTVAGGFAGAFALSVVIEAVQTGSLGEALQRGGWVFYGAAMGGAAAFGLGCHWLDLPLARLADLSIPAVAATHAIGRLGCFMGGCCFGRATDGPLAVVFTHPLAPAASAPIARHPVQLYESAFLLVLAIGFSLTPIQRIGTARRFAAYFALYSAGRMVLETLRGDAGRGLTPWAAVSTSQLIGFGVLVACAWWLWRTRSNQVAPIG